MNDERIQRIHQRAHALWEQAGRPDGQDAEHWSQAEREIAAEDEAQSAASEKGAARRGRKPKAAADESAEAPKAAADEATESATGTGGQEPQAATTAERVAPKARRGRKPKVVAEGSDAAE